MAVNFVLALVASARVAPGRAQSVAPLTTRDGHKDFDFLVGTWRTHYRLLKHRLSNDHEWYDCNGASVIRPFWDGYGNLEDGDPDVAFAESDFAAGSRHTDFNIGYEFTCFCVHAGDGSVALI